MIIVSTEEKNAVEKGKLKKEMVDGNAHCARLLIQCARIVFPAPALRKDRAEGGRRRARAPGGGSAPFVLGSWRLCAPSASLCSGKKTEQPLLRGQDGAGGRHETRGRSTEDFKQV